MMTKWAEEEREAVHLVGFSMFADAANLTQDMPGSASHAGLIDQHRMDGSPDLSKLSILAVF